MMVDAETIKAIGSLGAVAWLGILSYQAIKIRKNGNVSALEEKIETLQGAVDDGNNKIFELAKSVARIEGHLKIEKHD